MNANIGGIVIGVVIHTGRMAAARLARKNVASRQAIMIWNPMVGVNATPSPIANPNAVASGEFLRDTSGLSQRRHFIAYDFPAILFFTLFRLF